MIKKQLLKKYLFAIFVFSLFSCVSVENKIQTNSVNLSNDTFINLDFYPWSSELVITQRMTIKSDKKTDELLVQVEITKNKLVMVGLTPNGLDLFSIIWHKHGDIQYKKRSFIPDDLKPEYILADFLISHLPDINLKSQIVKGRLNVDAKPKTQLREVLDLNNQKILSVVIDTGNIWANKVSFTHHIRQYNLILETLSITNLNSENER